MSLQEADKIAINEIFNEKEVEIQYLIEKNKFYNKLTKTLIIIYGIGILTLFFYFKGNFPTAIEEAIPLITFIAIVPLVIIEVQKINLKSVEYTIKKELKDEITPILLKGNTNIETTYNVFNMNELNNSGIFTNEDYYNEDDAFIFNYGNKHAYIAEGETYSITRKNRSKCNIKRWLLISFKIENNTKQQTTITAKNTQEIILNKLPFIIFFTCFFVFLAIWLYLYYVDLFKNTTTYLTNPAQCIINTSFPILFLIGSIFVVKNIIGGKKHSIKKEKITINNRKLMQEFNIKSSNKIEAKNFLTQSFFMNFQRIKNTFNTKDIRCSFYDNKVLVAIKINKDFFEVVDIKNSVNNKLLIRETIKQLNTIKKIILTLDENK